MDSRTETSPDKSFTMWRLVLAGVLLTTLRLGAQTCRFFAI